jgi:serine/threonine protein kinase
VFDIPLGYLISRKVEILGVLNMLEGEVLGDNRYLVQTQLGKKAGRRTFLAQDSTTQDLVIIKFLAFSSDFEWDDLKLFEREAETLKTLNHPAIPRYLDYFEVNSGNVKGFALVQTYIPAQTLEQYIQGGRSFTQNEVIEVAKKILNILIYLHQRNPPVIHRDVKPSNILLGDRSGNSPGKVYLIDFGSVQTVAVSEGATRTVVGTYGYMPQEQFGGRTVPASDLYSLGATLIYMVTGTHPADLPEVDGRIQFEKLTNLTPGFRQWLQRMTEPNLRKRLNSATEALQTIDMQPTQDAIIVAVGKPTGSKIRLISDNYRLEILIPPIGFGVHIIGMGVFAITWNSFILFWTSGVMLAPFPISIPFLLFSLPFWGVGISMIWGLLFSLYGYTRLRIDSTNITQTYEIFGFKFRRSRPSARGDISKIIYIPSHYTKDSEGTRSKVEAQIEILVGTKTYTLGAKTGQIKTETEVEWLAQEISNWLGIKIERR